DVSFLTLEGTAPLLVRLGIDTFPGGTTLGHERFSSPGVTMGLLRGDSTSVGLEGVVLSAPILELLARCVGAAIKSSGESASGGPDGTMRAALELRLVDIIDGGFVVVSATLLLELLDSVGL